ncbi:MAG: site-specific integrase [Alphaproteobacteria bacterium]
MLNIMQLYLDDRKGIAKSHDTMVHHAKPVLRLMGGLDAARLNEMSARTYITARRAEGSAEATISKELRQLRAALNFAERMTILDRAPKYSIPVEPTPPRDFWLTKPQARDLVDACLTPHINLFVELAFATGARRSALLELQWDQVNLSTAQIDLGANRGKKRRAVVPINDRLKPRLELAWDMATCDNVIEWNSKPVKNVRTGFTAAVRRAGLPKRTSPHILRHSVATWMAMDNVPIEEIARYLGNSVEMVRRVYAKHTPDYLRRAARSTEF